MARLVKAAVRSSALFLVIVTVAGFSVVVGQAGHPAEPAAWLRLAQDCLISGSATITFEDEVAELFAFSCGQDEERTVFMVNLSDEERRIERIGEVEPLVPIFSSSGDISAIPSIVITLPGDGTVIHENPIPPRTVVVFRPIRQSDIRPHGLDE